MLLPMPQRLIVVIFYVSLPQSNHHCCLREDDDATRPETFGMMRNAMAPATMPRHKKQHNGKMHNAVAPKKCGGTNSSAATQKSQRSRDIANAVAQKKCHGTTTAQKAAHGAMPQQIMEGCGTKHNAAALITLPQHKAHCCGTKNCCGTQKLLWHKKWPQHKKMRSGTKQNAMAHKTALQHKNSAAECRRCMRKAMAKKTKNATNHNDRRGYRTG